MLSIYNNLSAGTQNVTGAYVIIMFVYRHLLTMHLHGKAANNAQKTMSQSSQCNKVHMKTSCHCN